MQQLMNPGLSRATGLPLRPLLCVAATAAGVYYYYYYVKKPDNGEKETEHAQTAHTHAPVQPMCPDLMESDLIRDVDGVSVQETISTVPAEKTQLMMCFRDSPSKAEESDQKASSAPEDSERTKLEDREKELEELVLTKWRQCLITTKKRKRLQEARCNMESQYKRMKEAVTHSKELIKNLQVSLAKSEEKFKQLMASKVELEEEHADLISDVDLLRCWVHEKEAQLCRMKKMHARVSVECSEERSRISKTKEALARTKESQRVLQAIINKTERKDQEVMEKNSQLEVENSFLVVDVELLKGWLNKYRKLLKEKDPAQT